MKRALLVAAGLFVSTPMMRKNPARLPGLM
jgi:hypothetical protein